MFHLNTDGDALQCRATKGRCPFGSKDEHFATAEDARTHFEQMQASSFISHAKPLGESAHDDAFNSEDHEIDYTPEQVIAKFKTEIQDRTFAMSSKDNPGEPGLILERLFGKEPDSDPHADLGSVELKTLRARSAETRFVSLGSLGMRGGTKQLRSSFLGSNFQTTLQAGEWIQQGNNYYSLLVDRKQRRVRVIIANKNKEFVSTNDFGWSFDDLDKKVDDKLKSIAIGLYETSDDAENKTVTFKNLLMGGFTRESLVDKLENGEVRIDFRFNDRYSRTTLVSKAESFCTPV